MSIINLFKKHKKDNPNYESTLNCNIKAKPFKGNITLLLIADTHGELASSETLQKKIKNTKYDLCCVLGDIHDYDYKFILENIPKDKIIALLGNHDRYSLLKEYDIEALNGKVIEFNNIKIGGIHGSFRYTDGDYPSFNHEESISFTDNMEKCDILLSHDKPFVFDYNNPVHDGLKGITKYLYDKQVPINIHGHLHKSYETKLNNDTVIKGVYLVEIIEIKDGKLKLIEKNNEEKNIKIKELTKNEVLSLLDEMFEIINFNMSNMIDTGYSKEENYKNWKNAMIKELKNPNKKWIGAFENNKLIGYFLYKINNDIINLDEIQIIKNHQGDKYTFINLFKYILKEGQNNIKSVTTYVNKNNDKSNAIVSKFGFKVLEEKERGTKYIVKFAELKEKLEKNNIKK